MSSEDPGDSGGVGGSGVNCNNLVPVPAETGVLGKGTPGSGGQRRARPEAGRASSQSGTWGFSTPLRSVSPLRKGPGEKRPAFSLTRPLQTDPINLYTLPVGGGSGGAQCSAGAKLRLLPLGGENPSQRPSQAQAGRRSEARRPVLTASAQREDRGVQADHPLLQLLSNRVP